MGNPWNVMQKFVNSDSLAHVHTSRFATAGRRAAACRGVHERLLKRYRVPDSITLHRVPSMKSELSSPLQRLKEVHRFYLTPQTILQDSIVSVLLARILVNLIIARKKQKCKIGMSNINACIYRRVSLESLTLIPRIYRVRLFIYRNLLCDCIDTRVLL